MNGNAKMCRSAASVAALSLLLVTPVLGGGFSIFEQGSKAMGMAGAFTAQADDPSALFHNVGGLAFFEKREIAIGMTLVTSTDEEFVGLPPVPGSDARGSLRSLSEPVPHFYWVQPVSETWNFGLAVNAPFGLKTDWEDPDNFSGRFINTESSMMVVDINPNAGIKLSENFGIGFGAIIRLSGVELNRRLPTTNPLTGLPVDIAAAHLESDMDEGFGWQVGILHEINNSFSWGFSYRSRITVDYSGDGRFTQIPTGIPPLDQLIAANIPFGQDLAVETEIEFPDTASLGMALALSQNALLELDLNWAGWSSFDELVIAFVSAPQFNLVRRESWDDVFNYRLGLRLGGGSGSEWRFGFVIDESPQPTAAVSPLLPDADRNGYTVGWGWQGERFNVDLALMYLDFDKRVNDVSRDGFNGVYSQTGWLFATTVGF